MDGKILFIKAGELRIYPSEGQTEKEQVDELIGELQNLKFDKGGVAIRKR